MTPGDKVADRFVLVRQVGEGGMGAVFLATDQRTGGQVALKTLTLAGDAARARFEREALTLQSLQHPNIVGYVAHGLPHEGAPWLAMEWVVGVAPDETELHLADALQVLRGAARGLAAAHARGVIHRDIKPSNLILVNGDPEQVKLLDFGIARGLVRGEGAVTLTATGETIGTPHYMAPEQARGTRQVDARVDVYALGAVLYQLIAGRPPLEGQSAIAVLAKILLEEPTPIDELVEGLPDGVSALVHAMLQKDPERRLPDARAVLDALDALPLPTTDPVRRLSQPARSLGAAERRLVCVVFVAGDGESASVYAPTLASGVGLDARAPMVDVVRQHGGHAELLADGTLVATFPGELPTDQANRAARCALALREVVRGRPIAVVAGQSLVSSVVPVGEALERGALLLAGLAAGAGASEGGDGAPSDGTSRVHIDGVVESLLGRRFECRPLGGERHELVDVHVARTGARRLLGVEVPCVGRRRELAAIAALFHECVEEPVARALVVVGAAGSGKTRLVREALDAMQGTDLASPAAPQLWEGRADAMRVGAPYGLVGDLMRRAAGVREADPVAVKQVKLAQFLGRFLRGTELRSALFFLGEMVRAPFPNEASEALAAARADATLMADAIRGAMLQLLRAATERAPLVLVLDDFQHGDHPSRELLHHALRQLEDAPLFVIALGRPELEQQFPGLWDDREPQTLRLTKLTKKACEQLVDAVVEGVRAEGRRVASRGVLDSIVERADGNAFFLEEMLRAAIESPTAALPDTVIAMLQARLASLDADARRVLRAASVFGVRFWGGAVGHLLGRADAPDATLEHLAEQELIDLVDERDVPSEWTWRFRQDLVREAAYAMLTDEDRRLGHQLAGQWLVDNAIADPLSLAGHHLAAGEHGLAAAALAQAAEQALEACDNEAALRHAERGLALAGDSAAAEADHGAVRARLLVVMAEAQRWRGAYAATLGPATEALGLLTEGEEAFYRVLGCAIVAAGQTKDQSALERCLALLVATPPSDAAAAQLKLIALCRGAHQRLGQRRLQDADALLSRAQTLARTLPADGPVVAAWLHTTFAARAHFAGDWVAYVQETERAVQAYDRARDLRHACNQRVRWGYGLVEMGEFERAVTVLRRAVDESAELGVPLVEGYALQNLGLAYCRVGELGLAHATLRNAESLGAAHQHGSVVAGACYYLAEVLLELGKLDEARACASVAAATFAPSRFHHSLALAAQARIALAAGDIAGASELAEAAARDRVPVAFAEGSDAIVDLTLLLTRRAAGDQPGAESAAVAGLARLEIFLTAVPDEAARARMRERVPAHAGLLAQQPRA